MDSTLNDRASLQVDGVAALPSGRRRSSRDSTTAARPAQILIRQGTVADTPCRFGRRMNAGEGPGRRSPSARRPRANNQLGGGGIAVRLSVGHVDRTPAD
jgi:hypothetical protein